MKERPVEGKNASRGESNEMQKSPGMRITLKLKLENQSRPSNS